MIPIAEPYFDETELTNVVDAVKSGWISNKGEFITKFEKEFSAFCGRKYGSAVSNGTAALHLALLTLGIKPGDEVLVPTLTFVSPINSILYCGAKPVFVDSHKDYWGIDPKKIEQAITKKTKAIIVVHLYGHPCDMDPILKIAKEHKLAIIEDAAESHGSLYKGRKAGSFGDISCFSFFANKNLTTGEGGMCLTDNKELRDKINLFKNHGMDPNKKYWHTMLGYNYRMTNVQAAIGCAQLEKLRFQIRRKKEIADQYRENLSKAISTGKITPHPKMDWAQNVIWLHTVLLNGKTARERDEVIEKLKAKGIDSRPFFYPAHTMPLYKNKKKFPVAEIIAAQGISLPSSIKLKREQITYISKTLEKII